MSGAPSLLAEFLRAFELLDLEAMLACFANDATAFLPVEHELCRMQGTAALRLALSDVVARFHGRGITGIELEPQEVVWQDYDDVAVATFHLRGEHLGRRTFVLRCTDGQWRIVHLHASNAALNIS